MIRRHFLLICALAFSPLAQAADPPTPKELLAAWQQRIKSVENLAVNSEWQEYINGSQVAMSQESIHSDNLGRLRAATNGGPTGKPKRATTQLYNGEFTTNIDEDLNRDKLGAARTAAATEKDGHYQAAIINNGLGPDGRGPMMHRNPLIFLDDPVIRDVAKLVDKEGAVTVKAVEGQEGIFEVLYQMPPEDDPQQFQHRCLVNQNQGWVITSHELTSTKSGAQGITSCEMQQDAQGVWLPKSGVWKNWFTTKPPAAPDMEWRFIVQSIKVNDPDFDASVFEVRLKPGTYVNDNRHGTVYTVGDEGAIGDQLTALAQEAIAKDAARLAQLTPKPAPIRKPMSPTFKALLIVGNVLVLSLIALAIWMRKKAA